MIEIISNKVFLNSKIKESKIILTTISRKIIAQLPSDSLALIKKSYDSPYEITLKVPKYYYDSYSLKLKKYPPYDLIKNERLIQLNDEEVYIIRLVEDKNETTLTVSCKSLEVKLSNLDVFIEDSFLSFNEEDKELGQEKIFSIGKMLKERTSWTLGQVSDSVKLDKENKYIEHYSETIDKKWYEFLTKDIPEIFDCVVLFDTWNRTVNYFKEEELGDRISLYLSKDNFITSLEQELDSSELVTILRVEGNSEMDIINAMCTGEDYIENYSYFIESGEMSEELINALTEYYKMLEIREPIWKQLSEERVKLISQIDKLSYEFLDLQARLQALEYTRIDLSVSNIGFENEDSGRIAKVLFQIQETKKRIKELETIIPEKEKEIDAVNKAITNINILCQKKTATDNDGHLIFNEELLNELREYYYADTYRNDSFIVENVSDLVNLAKRKLRDRCVPTKKWEIESVDFLSRVILKDSVQWKGDITLGDLIILYNRENNKEEFVYLIEYEYSPNEKSLKLVLSNKKTTKDNGMVIADYLSSAKNAMRLLDAKKYLLVEQKYKRMNVPREYIPKYKEESKKRPNGTIID